MKFCECGAALGPLLHHGYCCPLLSVRNKIRNSAHRSLAFGFRKIFADFINAKQLNSTILKSEPHLKDYFVLKDERINLQTVKTRGDITWSNDVNSIIFDVSTTESTASHNYTVGSAGSIYLKKKMYQYIHWDVNANGNKLEMLITETFCTIPQETTDLLTDLVKEKTEGNTREYNYFIKQFFERLSVLMQNIRASAYWKLYNFHSFQRYVSPI